MKPVQSCKSLENLKVIGFLSNNGPDPHRKSRSYQASIQFLVEPLTARQQIVIEMALRWRADDSQNKA